MPHQGDFQKDLEARNFGHKWPKVGIKVPNGNSSNIFANSILAPSPTKTAELEVKIGVFRSFLTTKNALALEPWA